MFKPHTVKGGPGLSGNIAITFIPGARTLPLSNESVKVGSFRPRKLYFGWLSTPFIQMSVWK